MPERSVSVEALARRLDDAWENRRPIEPPSETDNLGAEDSYAVQRRWTELRVGRGERIAGRKIGLTSPAMQEQLGVNEPDYGSLWASRHFPALRGRAEIPTDVFLQPRIEGEFAFRIGAPISGKDVTPEEVLAATEAVAVAAEVVDSRIADWRIALADTVADNASYGGFTLGPWSSELKEADLRTSEMVVHKNGTPATRALGAAVLGDPARAVAWLARKLALFGIDLNPGDVVLSGAPGGAVPVERGDVFTVEVHGQPTLTARFV